jgi:hypothetical protein
MKVLRIAGGAALWALAGIVGLLGAVLCLTLVLLPLGVPLLFLARRLFRAALALFAPPAVRHPVKTAGKTARKKWKQVAPV